jgi:hypothetical protein
MNIPIRIEGMKEAERFSAVCQKFPYEFYLRGEKFCVDPKSTLGVLAMMYSARENMYVDTADMHDRVLEDFVKAMREFMAK